MDEINLSKEEGQGESQHDNRKYFTLEMKRAYYLRKEEERKRKERERGEIKE